MRATLNLDEQAIQAALVVAPGKTKTQVINEALLEYSRRMRLKALLDLRGRCEPNGAVDDLSAALLSQPPSW